MEENMQHFWNIMFYYFKKDKNTTERQKQNCTVFGEGTVTDQMCQKQFEKFRARDFPLDHVPRLGKPFEVDSNQIETLIENNQYYTTWEIANILKIFKSIKLLVKMKMCLLFYRKN